MLFGSGARADLIRNDAHHFMVMLPVTWQTMTEQELDRIPNRKAQGIVAGGRSGETDGPVCLMQVLTKPEGEPAACLPDFQRSLEKSGARFTSTTFDATKNALVGEIESEMNGVKAAGLAYAFVGSDEMICLTFMGPPKSYYRDVGVVRSIADSFAFEEGYRYGSYRAFKMTFGRMLNVAVGVVLIGVGVWYAKIRGRRPKGERGLGGRRML